MARYIGCRLPALPPRRHEALPEGRPLLHRQVRRRAPRLSARPARPGRARASPSTACSCARSRRCAHLRPARAAVRAARWTARTRMKGRTGENLLALLERRLDNVVYRLGFATSRAEARQLVRHGHFPVNGRKASTSRRCCVQRGRRASTLRESSRKIARITAALEALERRERARAGSRSTRTNFDGHGEGAAGPRRHHAADPGTAHRRALLALVARARPLQSRRDHAMQRQELIAKNWRDLIRPRRLEAGDGRPPTATLRRSSACEPLERGFGLTLGNALRRVLLSSLQGAAITVGAHRRRAARVLDDPGRHRGRRPTSC